MSLADVVQQQLRGEEGVVCGLMGWMDGLGGKEKRRNAPAQEMEDTERE
jgi:hypothetical protein